MKWSARTWSVSTELVAPRSAVWGVLADTDRLNRLIGLSVADFASMDSERDAGRSASTRVAGVPVRWREAPFQWEKERGYTVRREYSSGPMSVFEGGVELEDAPSSTGAGTRVRIFATITPSGLTGKAILGKIAQLNLDKTLALLRDFATRGEGALLGRARSGVNRPLLSHGLRELNAAGVRSALVENLEEYLCRQPDNAVAVIRPHLLARLWEAPALEVTRLCLHASRAGLLNLQWAVLCPNCRVSKADYSRLENLRNTVHCDVCNINYETQFDRYVELRFSVHPDVRRATAQTYCIGGPAVTPHVWCQVVLRDGESASLTMPSAERRMRLRVLRSNHVLMLRDANSGEEAAVELGAGGWSPEDIPRPAHGKKLLVTNHSGREAVVALEEVDWNSEAVTAAQVTALQEFRDLFATEVLAPGQEVGIEQLTFFFSDLLNSTEMYECGGDAAAYGRVRRQFEVLRHHIAVNNGAVVKTIGDSVMAVFFAPADAVRASLAIQRSAPDAFGAGDGFQLRIGLHHGSAIAVNTDGLLDYFGGTVNIASRVETASRGADVVLTQAVWARPEVRRVLAETAASVEPFEGQLKGIARRIQLYRVDAAPDDVSILSEDERRREERRRTERRAFEV